MLSSMILNSFFCYKYTHTLASCRSEYSGKYSGSGC